MQHIDNANPSDVPPAQLNRVGRIKRRVPAHGAGEAADSNSSGGIVFFAFIFARCCMFLRRSEKRAAFCELARRNMETKQSDDLGKHL